MIRTKKEQLMRWMEYLVKLTIQENTVEEEKNDNEKGLEAWLMWLLDHDQFGGL